jgi:hypothetical protein
MTENTLMEIPLLSRLREIQYSPPGKVDDGQWQKTIEEVADLQDQVMRLQDDNKGWNEQCDAYEKALAEILEVLGDSKNSTAVSPASKAYEKAFKVLDEYHVFD